MIERSEVAVGAAQPRPAERGRMLIERSEVAVGAVQPRPAERGRM